MRRCYRSLAASVAVLALVFAAAVPARAQNTPPSANAGVDQQVLGCDFNQPFVGKIVTLDGSASSDIDAGDILSYDWCERISVGDCVPLGIFVAQPAFDTFLTVGVHNIELLVDDGQGGVGIDEVVVTVTATQQLPVANAGPD